MQKKSLIVETLLESTGGDLVFVPVEIRNQSDVKKLLETKNSVISENFRKELKLRRSAAKTK